MEINRSVKYLFLPLLLAGLAACGEPAAQRATTAAAEPTDTAAAQNEPAGAEVAREDAAAAESEREAALEAREEDLVRRESELDARQAAAARPAAPARRPTRIAPVAATSATSSAAATAAVTTVVPAGTSLSVGLAAEVSTRTAKVGDPVEGQLASDLVIDGRRTVPAGARVRGTVSQVISGSNAIGGTPTLGLHFDTLETPGGGSVPISGAVVQQTASEVARDTAKIVGGAAAGAVIGHQIDDDKGKVIGGILGGAAGALAAKKTGGNVVLPAGTVLTVSVDAPFEVTN